MSNRGWNRCDHCGLFAKFVDSYTPYGGQGEECLEPLDSVNFCQSCSDKLYAKFTERFANGSTQGDWQKSSAEQRAAKEAGLVWLDHGYVKREVYDAKLQEGNDDQV